MISVGKESSLALLETFLEPQMIVRGKEWPQSTERDNRKIKYDDDNAWRGVAARLNLLRLCALHD
jgi:hypothetical protein